jgi:hypothetical protein
VHQAEHGGVKGRAADAAGVSIDRPPVNGPIVYTLPAKRHPGFAEVDAYLMSTPGFQTALHKRKLAKAFDDANVRNGALAVPALGGTSATPVTSIFDEPRFNPARLGSATNDR